MLQEQEIIALKASKLNIKYVQQIVGERTGDFNCLFCPADVMEGEPFEGHVHVFPPTGAINVINHIIDIDDLSAQ